eukprot:TRINITY_DN4765_c0_g3_i2.p1 TRINITY_DN4765_c0_g3~~TRINITY_DN4765_c0_g3_i2.p1  ORF type:complete len:465 (+),score=205.70 TRINITY_DN4765_c0_g3_i2:311-1705(+)
MSDPFVWKLKGEKPSDKSGENQKRKQEEILAEIEKVKRRRRERELEKQQWEDERNRMQREKDASTNLDFEEKDNKFFLKQAKLASEIRIKEGRPKPFDVLFKFLNRDAVFDLEEEEPHQILKGMEEEELREVLKDIDQFLQLEGNENIEYWSALITLCEEKLKKKRDSSLRVAEEGVHEEVGEEISELFKGKELEELSELEKEIENNMKDESSAMVPEYWETLLKRMVTYKAKAILRKINQKYLEEYRKKSGTKPKPKKFQMETIIEYEEPVIVSSSAADAKKAQLEREAEKLRAKASAKAEDKILASEDEMYRREAAAMMEENEEGFKDEVALSKTYDWSDQHRPRRPKYFNRVHTGYEWNKYNQTHYDQDNPPPKVVQGYKFNIFYPNLIDPSKTPRYFLEKSDHPDYKIIRFHAGPPYEDIAFKIVAKPWDQSSKRTSFRNTFERGILHLWFNFKRYRYKR